MDKFFVNPDLIIPTLALLLPGYIWTECALKISPRPHFGSTQRYLRYIVYSLVNLAIWYSVIINLVVPLAKDGSTLFAASALLLCIIIVSPALLGSTQSLLLRMRLFEYLSELFKLTASQSGRTGWDAAFDRKKGCLVRLITTSGKEIFGIYNRCSRASAIPDERDLFLEQVWIENADGDLEQQIGSSGVWISKNSLSHILFYEIGELEDDKKKRIQPEVHLQKSDYEENSIRKIRKRTELGQQRLSSGRVNNGT